MAHPRGQSHNGAMPTTTGPLTTALLRAAEPQVLALLGLRAADEPTVRGWLYALAGRPGDHARLAELADAVGTAVGRWADPRPTPFTDADAAHPLGVGVLPVAAFALAAPALHAELVARGVPDNAARATTGDVGNQIAKHRRVHGSTGLHNQTWLLDVFSGGLVGLGRLQFELHTSDLGRPGERHRTLSVHVPATGPLEPAEVTRSLHRAAEAMPRWYPDAGRIEAFHCASWLLDPQLVRLAPGGNIAAFSERWTPWLHRRDDHAACYFAFDHRPPAGEPPTAWAPRLRPRSSLHRALIAHWTSGGHLDSVHGWAPLSDAGR